MNNFEETIEYYGYIKADNLVAPPTTPVVERRILFSPPPLKRKRESNNTPLLYENLYNIKRKLNFD